MTDYRSFIHDSLKKASSLALKHYGKVSDVSKKAGDNNQVLTQADIEVGDFLVSEVKRDFPSFNIIDEEAGVTDNQSDLTWVIDPIDGTSNFAVGLPTFGIMIGLLENDSPIAGGVALPAFKEIYVGQKNIGSYLNNSKLSVDKHSKLEDALVVYMLDGHPEDPDRTKKEAELIGRISLQIRNIRTTSSAYDLVGVVKGAYGASMTQTSKIWDNVAPQILVEEAGGIYTDFWGKPMNYSDPFERYEDDYTNCFGSPALHADLQTIIHT